jgi:thymidylate synthase
MEQYLKIVSNILSNGVRKGNRTGIDAITIPGAMFEHNMKNGFPLLTTKFVPFRLIASELEFFIKGITDKNWLIERNNHIWDDWCNPDIVPYGNDEATKDKMKSERDLGGLYGWQWRNFGAKYVAYDQPPEGVGIDQLANLVKKLKTDPSDRRMIVSAWNPVDIPHMALGLPFNIASYGLLLHLLAKESGLEEGRLVGFLADTHIYVNHIDGLKQQLEREPYSLPQIITEGDSNIFDWCYTDSRIDNYTHHSKIAFEIAV